MSERASESDEHRAVLGARPPAPFSGLAGSSALALRARTALANAREVTLLVDGLVAAPDEIADIVLHDRDGSPTFLCGPGSAVEAAARRRRAAQVCVEGRNALGERWLVRVRGRLHVAGVEEVDGTAVQVVGLIPDAVEIHDSRHRAQPVPLEQYHRVEPDPLACCAERIVAHTNAAHPVQLRETVARHADLELGSIAAAELADLTRHGVTLHWVDTCGARASRLHFPEPAGGAHDLARTLRAALRP